MWAPPTEVPPLGTDSLGRPIWDQLVYGSQVSLLVGVAATLIAVIIGTIVGVVGGFFGGWTDSVLSRLSEWFLVIPFIPLAIVLAAILGPVAAEHHPRHRRHVVAGHRAPDPCSGPDDQAAACTSSAVARSAGEERPHHGPPHPSRT